MTALQAGKLVTRLLGCYPSLAIHDPETYVAAVTALFCSYSLWVGERAVEQVATTSKFVPTLAEVKEACDHFAPARNSWADEWDWRSRLQLEERAQIEAERPPKQTYEEFKAEMARRGMPIDGRKPRVLVDDIADFKQRYKLTDAQFDALPDQPADADCWQGLRAPKFMDDAGA